MVRKFGLMLLATALTGSLCSCAMSTPTPTPSPAPTHTATPAPALTPEHGQNDAATDEWDDVKGAARHAVNDAERAVKNTEKQVKKNFDTMVRNGTIE